MKKFLIALAVVVTMLFGGVAVAEEAVTDTVATGWWNDFSNLSSVKLGYIGLDTEKHDEVIDETSGVTWDMCASLPAAEFKKVSIDVGISKAGIGFVAVTTDVAQLGDMASFPGSQFITLNAGAFVGKNFFGTEEGLEYDDGWIFGAVVNFIGW